MVGSNYLETMREEMPQSNENVILIGSNRLDNQNMAPYSNFKGCISSELLLLGSFEKLTIPINSSYPHTDIDIQLDDFKIDPFESAFGIRSGLSNVKVSGDITQGVCASFHIHRASIALPVDQTVTLTVSLFSFPSIPLFASSDQIYAHTTNALLLLA